jgi:hypothetical protein
MKRICVDGIGNFGPVKAADFADLVKRRAPGLLQNGASCGLDCK